jgi:hypothetical protein
LKSKIASVKMIRNGPSGERPSAFHLGESRSMSRIPSSSSQTSTERTFEIAGTGSYWQEQGSQKGSGEGY